MDVQGQLDGPSGPLLIEGASKLLIEGTSKLLIEGASTSNDSSQRESASDDTPPTSVASSTRPETVKLTVDGKEHTLKPRGAFDDFWRFTHARHAAFVARASGAAPPWSPDPVLATRGYCNVYRVLDRCSQYLITHVIEPGSQEPDELVFRVLLFNAFHKIETWELLCEHFAPMPSFEDNWNEAKYNGVLSAAKSAGVKLYTGAFQKPSPRVLPLAHASHMALIAAMMNGTPNITKVLQDCTSLAECFVYLQSYPGMGPFNTFQLIHDLSYTSVFNFHPGDLVIAGPGSMAGLELCFGKSVNRKTHEAAMRWMAETQAEHFARLELDFAGLGPDKLPMEALDIEHTLCEFSKYTRERPRGKGSWVPREGPPPTENLPKAWAHPDRKIPRIAPMPKAAEKQFIVDKIYEIDKIVERREKVNRGRKAVEYLVHWKGYGVKDRTWQPAKELLEDAPLAVKEFEDAHKKKTPVKKTATKTTTSRSRSRTRR
ncbi:hypothetical protein EXIGLDRAFT_614203 [Exidia glandulosa HHB12029]|uniref:Chromo domain-containing protein n=1 Tax=Exidia glandulosa HHB12029 TaxID=1314781 RepID=A0A165HW32_EXIGL|nr:hypothetical protein EXIGLDRAFT_614203 [Exidia glandulosa HHB12029]